MPCEPSALPKYDASHELDMKKKRHAEREQRQAQVRKRALPRKCCEGRGALAGPSSSYLSVAQNKTRRIRNDRSLHVTMCLNPPHGSMHTA